MARDESLADIWACNRCQLTLLRADGEWLTQIEEPTKPLVDWTAPEVFRRAA
jgi:hypothetical protein